MVLDELIKGKKAIVITSGGIDSVTLLHYAAKQCDNVIALNFVYGSKHNDKETVFAEYHAKLLNVPFQRINLDFNTWGYNSSLLKSGEVIPEGHYAADNMKSTVVPFRNGILLSIAAGLAETKSYDMVLLGSHAGDHQIYPDCRSEFTTAMSSAIEQGTYNNIKVISPFNNITKADIVKIGLDNNVPYDKTWSCYKGEEKACLKCGTCVERTESFHINNTTDPSLSNKEWQQGLSYLLSIK